MRDWSVSPSEKSVQRKVREGYALDGDDKRFIQTRLRAMQMRGELDGQTVGIPSGALNFVAMPNVQPAIDAMNQTARSGMNRATGETDFGGSAGELETAIRQLNGGAATAAFTARGSSHYMGIPVAWTATGSFSLGALHWHRPGDANSGAGTMNGGTTTGGGRAGGNTSASGVSGTAGASGTYSGVNGSGSAAASTGGANSTGNSGGATASQGGSATSYTDTYDAPITCRFNIRAQPELSFNPLSWGASLAETFMSPTTGSGSAANCGRVQFSIQGT